MTRYGMVIDISRCTGCYNCFLTCRDEFAGNDYPGYSAAQPMSGMNWMRLIERERGQYPKVKVSYTPITCMHCDDAPCIKVAQNKAVYRRADGIVIIDPRKAKGQKQIVQSCPYRVIEWNEEAQLPQKCTFCAHMLDNGEKVPRCVESCPTDAIIFGDLDDPESEISRLVAAGTENLRPEFDTKPKVTYLNLAKKFIAGTVVYGDVDQVAAGIKVVLKGDGKEQEIVTNGFGDFEFEDLPDNRSFTVVVEVPGYRRKAVKASTTRDTTLPEIKLTE